MKKATIKDVANLSGLAIGTISKYLNGGTLKDDNKRRVEDAIEKLGYQVDVYARGLMTNKTNTVGVILPELDNAFYAKIVSKIEENLKENGYVTEICDSKRDHKQELKTINWFVSRRVDAIILVPCSYKAEDYVMLKSLSIPIIFLDQFIEGLDYEFIIVDNCTITKKGVDYLINQGHTKISMVCAPEGVYTADRRYEGFRESLEENNIPFDSAKVYRVEEDIDKAYNVCKDILKRKECTALFASNLPSFYGALFAINELKLNIPADISLLGFDDMMFTKIVRPKPTVIDQPISKMAGIASSRILELIEAPSSEDRKYRKNCLECSLTIGDSVKKI